MNTIQIIDPLKFADNVTIQPFPPAGSQLPIPSAVGACDTLPSSIPPATNPSSLLPDPASDRFLQIRIESLKAKQRADSFFNSLDEEQASRLGHWMIEIDSLMEVYRRVTAPPPEGLGLHVHLATLSRLRDAWRADELSLATSSMYDVIIGLEEQTDLNQTARIQTAMNHLLHQTTFELMRKHPASPLLKELLGNIQKLTDLDLKRQKLALERERLHRKTTPPTSPQPHQYHRVDLNIVPPTRDPAPVITSHPERNSEPRKTLAAPTNREPV